MNSLISDLVILPLRITFSTILSAAPDNAPDPAPAKSPVATFIVF
jgi:hypothetical protein